MFGIREETEASSIVIYGCITFLLALNCVSVEIIAVIFLPARFELTDTNIVLIEFLPVRFDIREVTETNTAVINDCNIPSCARTLQ